MATVLVTVALGLGAAGVMVRRGVSSTHQHPAGADRAEVEAMARAFFAALNEARWAEAGARIDPVLAGVIRQQALNQMLNQAEERHLGRRSPDRLWLVPDSEAVALLRPYAGDLLRGHEQGVTVAQVVAMSPGELPARLLSYRIGVVEDLPLARLRYLFLGAAVESDTLAHVLYRAADPELTYYTPWYFESMEVHRRGNRWVIVPPDHAFGPWDLYLTPVTPGEASDARPAATPPARIPLPPAPVPAAWANAADRVARSFVTALHARRYDDAAAEIDPRDAEQERRLRLSSVVLELHWRDHPPLHPPVIPDVVALAPEELDPLLRTYSREPLFAFPRVRTVAELAALTSRQLAARELDAFVETDRGPGTLHPARLGYIGTVVENDSVAHALYRWVDQVGVDTLIREPADNAPELPAAPGLVRTLELRPAGGRWYVSFDREFALHGPYTRKTPGGHVR